MADSADSGVDVSVLIPSRKRPEKLLRAIDSLKDQTRRRLEIIVGLDDDDPTARQLPPIEGVQYVIGPRPRTLGSLLNTLAAQSTGQWLMGLADEYVITCESDWIAEVLRAGQTLPRGIGLLYLNDLLERNFPTLPVISRLTYETVGYFVSDRFPFWFTDTWWNEIAECLGGKIKLPVDARLPEARGKTHGMADLAFWVDFFEATRPQRVADALKLLKVAYDPYSVMYFGAMAQLGRAQETCARRTAHLQSPDFINQWGGQTDSPPGPHYASVKSEAEPVVAQFRAERAKGTDKPQPSFQTGLEAQGIRVKSRSDTGTR